MYEEKEISYKKRKKEKKKLKLNPFFYKIDWILLLKKLFVLFVSLAIIIFTISRINKQNERNNGNYNKLLITIQNTAMSYYERNLPKNIGDSSSFLLEEMQKQMNLEEVKEEDVSCDKINSYIIFTKTKEEEYRLKIFLKCPKKESTIEQNWLCKENQCQKK